MVVGCDNDLIPGALYRDLDGTVVHLLAVQRDLCRWTPLGKRPMTVETTHAENFRMRFRRRRDLEPVPAEAA